jgi:hypothetical protein
MEEVDVPKEKVVEVVDVLGDPAVEPTEGRGILNTGVFVSELGTKWVDEGVPKLKRLGEEVVVVDPKLKASGDVAAKAKEPGVVDVEVNEAETKEGLLPKPRAGEVDEEIENKEEGTALEVVVVLEVVIPKEEENGLPPNVKGGVSVVLVVLVLVVAELFTVAVVVVVDPKSRSPTKGCENRKEGAALEVVVVFEKVVPSEGVKEKAAVDEVPPNVKGSGSDVEVEEAVVLVAPIKGAESK